MLHTMFEHGEEIFVGVYLQASESDDDLYCGASCTHRRSCRGRRRFKVEPGSDLLQSQKGRCCCHAAYLLRMPSTTGGRPPCCLHRDRCETHRTGLAAPSRPRCVLATVTQDLPSRNKTNERDGPVISVLITSCICSLKSRVPFNLTHAQWSVSIMFTRDCPMGFWIWIGQLAYHQLLSEALAHITPPL